VAPGSCVSGWRLIRPGADHRGRGGKRARRIGRSAPDERPPPLPAAAACSHGLLNPSPAPRTEARREPRCARIRTVKFVGDSASRRGRVASPWIGPRLRPKRTGPNRSQAAVWNLAAPWDRYCNRRAIGERHRIHAMAATCGPVRRPVTSVFGRPRGPVDARAAK
jgi:hypothetical protein